MCKKIIIQFMLGSLLMLISSIGLAKSYPEPTDDYINDFANVINQHDAKIIREKLIDLETQTGIEMVVVTIDSIKPYKNNQILGNQLAHFAKNLFNQWGVGQMPGNDGVMLLVAVQDKRVRVQMGKGYGGSYNSAMKRIIDEELIPEFRAGNVSQGISTGVDLIIADITVSPDVIFGLNWLELALVIVGICAMITGVGFVTKGNAKAGWGLVIAGFAFLLGALLLNRSREENTEDHYSEGFGGGSSDDDDGASGYWGDD